MKRILTTILTMVIVCSLSAQVNLKYINIADSLQLRGLDSQETIFRFDSATGITFPDGSTQNFGISDTLNIRYAVFDSVSIGDSIVNAVYSGTLISKEYADSAYLSPLVKSDSIESSYGKFDSISIQEITHMFIYFGDSAISLSYTTSWQHLTNTYNDMYVDYELDGFTTSGDTIIIPKSGDYDFLASHTADGDNGETVSIRFYNITQTTGIPTAGAQTMSASNNFREIVTSAYFDCNKGDRIVMQYKGDANGTSVYKNGTIKIRLLHD